VAMEKLKRYFEALGFAGDELGIKFLKIEIN